MTENQTGTPEFDDLPVDEPDAVYAEEPTFEPEPEPQAAAEDALGRILDAVESINQRLTAVEQSQEEVKILAQRDPLDVDYSEFAVPKTPPGPPAGRRRFVSRFTDGTYVKQGGKKILVNGETVFMEPVQVDFNNGICDLPADDERVEWLLNHPEYGVSVWEDPTAAPRGSNYLIVNGVRTTESAPHPVQGSISAPME